PNQLLPRAARCRPSDVEPNAETFQPGNSGPDTVHELFESSNRYAPFSVPTAILISVLLSAASGCQLYPHRHLKYRVSGKSPSRPDTAGDSGRALPGRQWCPQTTSTTDAPPPSLRRPPGHR